MELHISKQQADDPKFLEAQMKLAKVLGLELMIDYPPAQKPKPFDCVLWLDENDDYNHGEFDKKSEALKWAREQLTKHPNAIIDLKKWNAKGDDYDYWFYRMVDGKFTEVDHFGW